MSTPRSFLRTSALLLRQQQQTTPASAILRRSFQTTSTRAVESTPIGAIPAVRKPVGAFRGGIFGFLFGSTLSGAAVYYYILEEYRVSNTLLTEDIYALQAAVQRIESYTRSLEEKIVEMQTKRLQS